MDSPSASSGPATKDRRNSWTLHMNDDQELEDPELLTKSLCQVCCQRDSVAVVYCVNCQTRYCAPCDRIHKLGNLRNHRLIVYEDWIKQTRAKFSNRPTSQLQSNVGHEASKRRAMEDVEQGMCKLHSKKLEKFCDRCQYCICDECATTVAHSNHHFIPIPEAVQNVVKVFKEQILLLKNRTMTADVLLGHTVQRKIQQDFEDVKKKIEDQFDELQAELTKKRNKILDELAAKKRSKKKKAEKTIKSLEKLLEEDEKLVTMGETLLNNQVLLLESRVDVDLTWRVALANQREDIKPTDFMFSLNYNVKELPTVAETIQKIHLQRDKGDE